MRIKVLAVGKQKPSPEYDIVLYYKKRCKWSIEIKEIEIKKYASLSDRKEQEGRELLKQSEDYKVNILLDCKGKLLDSIEFAKMLDGYQNAGKDVNIIIGGSDGLSDSVLSRGLEKVSFGRMTMPHMLVRSVLMEQLYRAGTILDGHPYNK